MVRTVLALACLLPFTAFGGTAGDIARAVRENSFDRDECYRVRDLTLIKEDIRVYLTDGYLIFSKPVAGRRIAAVFSTDVEGGDGEVIVLPPDRAERRSLATFIDAPNLDEHIRAALLLFTGDVYEQLKSQMANNPANRKAPEMAPVLDEQWTPVLRNLGTSYQVRLTLDLMAKAGAREQSVRRHVPEQQNSATSTWFTTRTTSSRFWWGSSRRGRTGFTSTPGPVSRRDPRARIRQRWCAIRK